MNKHISHLDVRVVELDASQLAAVCSGLIDDRGPFRPLGPRRPNLPPGEKGPIRLPPPPPMDPPRR
jgi:hypothetical protein